jgi:hypothetical protein
MIVAKDPDDATTASAEWSFTTMSQPSETVSTPATPAGDAVGNTGQQIAYTTHSAVSSLGHTVEYRFDWDDGTMSPWSTSTVVSHSWAAAGTYSVKAQARCQDHTTVESTWSAGLDVVISDVTETVSVPDTPTGPANGQILTHHTFNTGGAVSSLGHTVEYRFDWGNGQFSSWSTSGSNSHSWVVAGTYQVKAQARCQDHPAVESAWSAAASIEITLPESVQRPEITTYTPLQELGIESTFQCTGASSNMGHALEYQYDYGDGTISTWSSSPDGAHTYAAVGTYDVRAKARCEQHTDVESYWSDKVEVTIYVGAETVTTPYISEPNEDHEKRKWLGIAIQFIQAGATSTHGHSLEYRWDFGDGTITPWSSSYGYNYTYSLYGIYHAKAQARCRDHTDIESTWSDSVTIYIMERISTPDISGPVSGSVEVPLTFTATGASSAEGHALEYQFYVLTYPNDYDSGFGAQGWQSSPDLEFTFPAGEGGRYYYIRVQARCATHTWSVSHMSDDHRIAVSNN